MTVCLSWHMQGSFHCLLPSCSTLALCDISKRTSDVLC